MTQALLDSLAAVHGGEDDRLSELGIYREGVINWTSYDKRDQRWCFEVTDEDDNIARLWLTRDELLALHAKLTITLLRDAK
jgi:hypothetical protein